MILELINICLYSQMPLYIGMETTVIRCTKVIVWKKICSVPSPRLKDERFVENSPLLMNSFLVIDFQFTNHTRTNRNCHNILCIHSCQKPLVQKRSYMHNNLILQSSLAFHLFFVFFKFIIFVCFVVLLLFILNIFRLIKNFSLMFYK